MAKVSEPITRQTYLYTKTLISMADSGARLATWLDLMMAREAIASTAIEHPEWDMDELKTWEEWEADG